jgi:hypothetical protein
MELNEQVARDNLNPNNIKVVKSFTREDGTQMRLVRVKKKKNQGLYQRDEQTS